MIAKLIAPRAAGRSDFAGLTRYLVLKPAGEIAYTQATNCGVDDPLVAAKVVAATQALNTRTQRDKTMHLVVSFPGNESPNEEQLRDIEETICQQLGMADHQRLSVAHRDTDHAHLHIAINRIHPETLNAIDPFYPFYKLDSACAVLEQRHGLARDNRIGDSHERGPSARVRTMESHSDLTSFRQWLQQDNTQAALQSVRSAASSWEELHAGLVDIDLVLRQRERGLVVASRSQNTFCAASQIDPSWSQPKLEIEFGEFLGARSAPEEQKGPKPAPGRGYSPKPRDPNNSELWEQYKKEQEVGQRARSELRKRDRDAIREIRQRLNKYWHTIQRDQVMSRSQKFHTFARIKTTHMAEINALKATHLERLGDVPQKQSWADFKRQHGVESPKPDRGTPLLRAVVVPGKSGGVTVKGRSLASAVIDTWIAQRNQTGQRVKDFVPFAWFDGKAGTGTYRGCRALDHGVHVALLQRGDRIQVIAISEYQRRRWQRHARGDQVYCNAKAQLVSKGRER